MTGAVPGAYRVRIKVCGITRPEDAAHAEALGVDAIGMIFAPRSRRRVDLDRAAEVAAAVGPFVARVGVFVDPSADEVVSAIERLRLHVVQLHGTLPDGWSSAIGRRVALVRAVAWRPGLDLEALLVGGADAVLVDGPDAGSGRAFDWAGASSLRGRGRWMLAGGLDPTNVAAAIARLRPPMVDVASGVEAAPGIKDPVKMAAFVAAVRAATATGAVAADGA